MSLFWAKNYYIGTEDSAMAVMLVRERIRRSFASLRTKSVIFTAKWHKTDGSRRDLNALY